LIFRDNIEIIQEEIDKPTTIRDITEYLNVDSEITINIVNSSVRHYRENRLIKRNHNPYKRPYQHLLTKKGKKQLEWLENGEFEDYIIK